MVNSPVSFKKWNFKPFETGHSQRSHPSPTTTRKKNKTGLQPVSITCGTGMGFFQGKRGT